MWLWTWHKCQLWRVDCQSHTGLIFGKYSSLMLCICRARTKTLICSMIRCRTMSKCHHSHLTMQVLTPVHHSQPRVRLSRLWGGARQIHRTKTAMMSRMRDDQSNELKLLDQMSRSGKWRTGSQQMKSTRYWKYLDRIHRCV